MRNTLVLGALALLLWGCGGQAQAPRTSYQRDVKPLLEAHCTGCHTDGGIAPFALTSLASAQAYAKSIKQATAARTMPPWLAAPGCATYQHDESLTDAQIALLGAWADEGAPAGDPADASAPVPVTRDPGLSRVDVSVAMPAAYSPQLSPDDYRCFLLDWPYQTQKFVTGFRAHPGNARIVHHVIAYLIPPARVAEYERLDQQEPGEGYTCFGGPGGRIDGATWLGAWAPGSNGSDVPAGTGLKVPPGAKIALQVHYNTQAAQGTESDRTSVDFKVDDQVQTEAFLMPFTNPAWVGIFGASTMQIPAGEKDAMQSYSGDPTQVMARLSNGAIPNGTPVLLHSASLHMHTLGTSAELQVRRGGGTSGECLLDIAHWDFNWQRSYRFDAPKRFAPGDELYLECHWDNSGAKARDRTADPKDVTWGEGTGDEMCLGIVYVSKA